MPKMTAEEQERFLAEREVLLHISVVRDDGSPLVTPIWYLCEEGAIWFTPRKESEWFGCLRRDPRVCLCIDEQPLPYRKVVIHGHAELVHDLGEDDKWRDRYQRIAERYVPTAGAVAYIEQTIDQPRGLYRVMLADAEVSNWRMPVGDEPGDGIWAQRYYGEGTLLKRG